MTFRNAEAWKSAMKRYAKENNMNITDVQQRYILDEFASKIAASPHNNSLVLKGGFIVSNLLGIDNRTTKDIDLTCRSVIYSKDEILDILNDIINTETSSFFNFEVVSISEAQVDDGNSGFIAMLDATNGKTRLSLKLDISNNTLIYPRAISFSFDSLFTGERVDVMSYPIENIIAEKFETTLDRGEFNTRMRDLFDVYMLMDTSRTLIDSQTLSECIFEVSKERGTFENLYYFDVLVQDLISSSAFNETFEKYKKKAYPSSRLTLEQVFETFAEIYRSLEQLLPEKEGKTVTDRVVSAGERARLARSAAVKESSNDFEKG